MRKLLLLSAAAAIAACSDTQHPTSPDTRSPTSASRDVSPSTDGIKVPQAKPQPGFTSINTVLGPHVFIPAGLTNTATVVCPAGSVATGGGYGFPGSVGGSAPFVEASVPFQNGW